jgi:hypothetical protein
VAKAVKIIIWILVFAAFIGAGAYQASRSDPFPPGVEDPGARPDATPTVTPTRTPPSPTAWDLDMDVTSQHVLHVGGSCRTDWRVTGSVTVQPNGRAAGDADAKLVAPAACDFSQAQVQTKAIRLVVVGTSVDGKLRLGFSEAGRTPVGSHDLGGLTNTLSLIHPSVRLRGSPTAKVLATRPDGDLGTYSSSSHLRLSLQ